MSVLTIDTSTTKREEFHDRLRFTQQLLPVSYLDRYLFRRLISRNCRAFVFDIQLFDRELRFARGPWSSFVIRRQGVHFAQILQYFVI